MKSEVSGNAVLRSTFLVLQLSSEEQILFGTPKYSEFHGTAPLEETGGKAWVLFYNMHTVSDLRLIYIVISRLLSL